jgi:Zn finger protein HypA/HybF involved in hydrogenase expression
MPSVAYKVNDKKFSEAVKSSTSIRQVLMKLGLNETGSAYRVFKKRIKILKLDISHFTGQGHLRGKSHNWAIKQPIEEILIENSTYANIASLKNRLVNEHIVQYKCSECAITNEWNNKPIALQLDHINGIYDDHRIENLRFLCPNCHSQTSTFAFAGKNIGKNK